MTAAPQSKPIILLFVVVSAATLVAGLYFTSMSEVVFSLAIAANVLIIGKNLARLNRAGLLLTPAVFFLALNLPAYSFGNIGVVANATDEFIELHVGAVDNYPFVAVLSTIGLLIYSQALKMFEGRVRRSAASMLGEIQARISHVSVLVTLAMAVAVLGYLSAKYAFVGGYFRDVENQFDRFIASAQYSFIFLAAAICTCAAADEERARLAALGRTGMLILLILVLGMRSRTTMLLYILFSGTIWLTLRPRELKRAFGAAFVTVVIVFGLGTIVKLASTTGEGTQSITENLEAILGSSASGVSQELSWSIENEAGRRVAGFEYPAALMLAQGNGAPLLLGEGLISSATGALPSLVRPEGEYSERIAIWNNAKDFGLVLGDVTGITLSTGLAELGYLGVPLVYILLALWHVSMWRVASRSPLLMVSYLAQVPSLVNMDLLWDAVFESLRIWLFMLAVLVLLRRVVLPGLSRWRLPDATRTLQPA